MNHFRIERLNEVLKRELGQLFLKEMDFPADVLVTITKTETSQDALVAKIFVSVWPSKRWLEISKMLSANIYFLQKKIDKRLRMRPVPRIIFKKDEGESKLERVEKALQKIKNKEM